MNENEQNGNEVFLKNEARLDRLVIRMEDLDPEEILPEPEPKKYPGMPYEEAQKRRGIGALGASSIVQNGVAGFIGGFVAWGLTELFFADDASRSAGQALLETIAWGAVLGGVIGGLLAAANGITGGTYTKAGRDGAIGLFAGLIGGGLGGGLAQVIYSLLGGGFGEQGTQQVLARTIGWAFFGMFIGFAQGVASGSGRRMANGLIGGLLGGALGGLAFDALAQRLDSGAVSRLFGTVAMGAACGLAIGMVEEARKEAWLKVVRGPQQGKQFIVYDTVTRIGSSPKCELVLVKDPAVQAEHCRIVCRKDAYYLECPLGRSLSVNGFFVHGAKLKRGDTLEIGGSALVYEDKRVPRKQDGYHV